MTLGINDTSLTVASDTSWNKSVVIKTTSVNNATNNIFIDSSANNLTITRAGNTTQGTFSPFSNSGFSGYFDASYITTPANSAQYSPGTNSFTIEGWFFFNAVGSATLWGCDNGSGSTAKVIGYLDASSALHFDIDTAGGASAATSVANIVSVGQWYHIAFVRNNTTATIYINGVAVATGSNSANVTGLANGFNVGYYGEGGANFNGYVSNFRYVNGTAVYISTFVPPTAPLTAIANTALLCLQDNRFKDNSTNNFTFTATGIPSTQAFTPFAPSAYSAVANGGSAYFDGNGAGYLSAASTATIAFGTGDFTVETWMYSSTAGASYLVDMAQSVGDRLLLWAPSSTQVGYYVGANAILATVPDLRNAWHHLAVCRSGGVTKLFLDGVQVGTNYTDAKNYLASSIVIAHDAAGATAYTGYLADVRIIKGTALYTTSFTPPTAPLTAITNTSVLLNGTNAGVFDNTGKVDVGTVGTAKVSTTIKKFIGSIACDGASYAVSPANNAFGYGTGDFTIEFWLYLNSTASDMTVVSNLATATGTQPHLYYANNGGLHYYTAGTERIISNNLAATTWYHVAVCRVSGSTKMYINGVQNGSTFADASNYGTAAPLGIGTYWASGAPYGGTILNGNIEDLRITKGLARYTTTFTPPTIPF